MFDLTLSAYLLSALYVFAALPAAHICLAYILPEHRLASLPLIVSTSVALLSWLGAAWMLTANRDFAVVEFLVGLAALLGLLIGFAQFWFLINRGYSLNLVVLLSRQRRVDSPGELARLYGGEQGLEWLLAKRLDGLAMLGLIHYDKQRIVLTTGAGARVAKTLKYLTALLGVYRGG